MRSNYASVASYVTSSELRYVIKGTSATMAQNRSIHQLTCLHSKSSYFMFPTNSVRSLPSHSLSTILLSDTGNVNNYP